MKSISQIAKELGVSRQYVYARVKEYGLSLDSLKRYKQGRETFFDDESVNQIVLACQNEHVNRVKEGRVNDDMRTRLNESIEQVYTLKQELEAVKQELEAKTKELEEAHAKTMEDQQEIARLRSIEEEQRHTISSQAETIRLKTQQELLKLEARAPERVGVFGQIRRLFARKQKE